MQGASVSHVSDSPPPEFAERVADEVKRLKDERKMSKKEVAKRAGISRSVLDRYENGGMPERPSRLAALAKVFDCSMDYLWGRTAERKGFYSGEPGELLGAAAQLEEMATRIRAAATSPAEGDAAADLRAVEDEARRVAEESDQRPPERRAGGARE